MSAAGYEAGLAEFSQGSLEIAELIGSAALQPLVGEVIAGFHEQGLIAHGIKRADAVGIIANQGVAPLTPEGRMGSYWTSGQRVFLNATGRGAMRACDTTFFDYGSQAIAFTSFNVLAQHGIDVPAHERDHQAIILHERVPADAIELLVNSIESDPAQTARQRRQQLERFTLLHMLDITRRGLAPGQTHELASIKF